MKKELVRDQGVAIDKDLVRSNLTRNQQNKINYYWRCVIKEDPKLRSILKELSDKEIAKDNTWSGIVRSLGFW